MDAKKLKSLIKNPAPKQTFGTDPKDPWSAKANIAESALLDRYLLSRGIQPKFASKDMKVAHSKSGEFKKWLRDHQNVREEIQQEDMGHMATKGEGGKTSDRKRELEKAKHSYNPIKTPRGPGSHNEEVSQKDIDKFHKKLDKLVHSSLGKSSVEKKMEEDSTYGDRADKLLARSHSAFRSGDKETSSRAHKLFLKARDKHWSNPVNREKSISAQMSGATKDYADREKKYGPGKVRDSVELDGDVISENIKPGDFVKDTAYGQGHTYRVHKVEGNNLVVNRHHGKDSYGTFTNLHKTKVSKVEKPTNEEVVTEASSARVRLFKALEREKEKRERGERLGAALTQKSLPPKHDEPRQSQTPKMAQEDVGDAKAAVNADGMPNPHLEPTQERKKQLSKSARIIKSIYKKKKMMLEDMYDHEKEDKSVATYGKKPKMDKADPKDSSGENKPQAAAVLTGGTTLTGQKRDDIEIDPMMRARPGQPDPTKKKDGDKEKDDKKKDK